MMKRIVAGLLFGILIFTACAPATTGSTRLPFPSGTPTLVPPTFTPSPTQIPPTRTLTPLPTIPTFTPTFDVRTIITVTPAAPATCPKENPAIAAEFSGPYYDEILAYLNAGGALTKLSTSSSGPKPDSNGQKVIDLTGDGLSEIVFPGLANYHILGCQNGKYQNLFEFDGRALFMALEEVLDLNKDGIPELVFYSFNRYGFAEAYIIGWDGSRFRSLINVGTDVSTGTVIDLVSTTADYKIADTNGDGLKEIVLENDLRLLEHVSGLTLWLGIPFRNETITLGWNGKNFVNLKPENYGPPEYRFQAIQDGDQQVRYRNYTKALSLYQQAIFSEELEWWSPERKEYKTYIGDHPNPKPTPIADNTEYPRLAAYAYYRIILLDLVQGNISEAETTYSTLQQKFGSDPYGHPYVEMATTFWETYQSTHKMYDGCAAAIEYAVEHPEILIPLGSDYHGSQSHIYVPADVCPFR